MFKRSFRPLFLLMFVSLAANGVLAQKGSRDGVWKEIGTTSAGLRSEEQAIVPAKYRAYQLDKAMLETILNSAPTEFRDSFSMSSTIISLPMPDGGFERFRIERSLIVEPGLLEKFPELGMTFRGQGVDDPSATVRLDLMPAGFHSMILSSRGTIMVDPYAKGDTSNYISYYKRDVQKPAFSCGFDNENAVKSALKTRNSGFDEFIPDAPSAPAATSGTQLRTYRIAIAATGEYTAAVGGGTVGGAQAAQTTIMNRVNGVYERDLAIRMVIVGNNNLVVYTDGATDPYSNTDGLAMLGQNTTNLNAVIGSTAYDIGHVFSTGGGGVATVGVTCGNSKARGVTGLQNPVGDVFAIDYVAHELGHQWGASHTFNAGTGSCAGGNRSGSSAFEPGSGVTIMGYAGICDSQDLAGNSIDSFHVKSLEDIVAFSQTGSGNTCAAVTATGNTPPSISIVGGPTFNIPRQTPFSLTAAATDTNGDTVTYDWQQYDLGPVTSAVPNSDADGSARPIFRAYSPNSNPTRNFPQNQFILNNSNVPPNTTGSFMTGELLPAIARTMNFQVIARDNRASGGGINTATASVVVAATGPFRVISPNSSETWFLNSNPTVTWDTGGSAAAPINAANVRILLSTDGGATFPTVLVASTANDGSEQVVSPSLNSNTARIRVEPIGNVFFDISDANFNISTTAASNGIIAGRVTTSGGRGVGRIYVTLTGGSATRVALTNAFGYFAFETVGFGTTYTITPTPRKGTTFSPANIVRNHNAAATDVNFTSN